MSVGKKAWIVVLRNFAVLIAFIFGSLACFYDTLFPGAQSLLVLRLKDSHEDTTEDIINVQQAGIKDSGMQESSTNTGKQHAEMRDNGLQVFANNVAAQHAGGKNPEIQGPGRPEKEHITEKVRSKTVSARVEPISVPSPVEQQVHTTTLVARAKDPSHKSVDAKVPRIVYGIQTSARPRFLNKCHAQFDTWASDLPAERFFVLGPKCEKGMNCTGQLWKPTDCVERSQMCKGAAVVAHAWKLLQEFDFDWLINIYEDQYIQRELFEKYFTEFDPSVPQVLGMQGCGRGTKRGRTCPAVEKNGGICGGTGLYYSRAAVQLLFKDGLNTFWEDVNEYPFDIQVDMGMSCIFYKRGVQLNPSRVVTMQFNAKDPLDKKRLPSAKRVALFHIVGQEDVPDWMRNFHDALHGGPKNSSTIIADG